MEALVPIALVAAFCGAFLWAEELFRPYLYINTILNSEERRLRYRMAMRCWVGCTFVFATIAILTRGDTAVVYGGLIGLSVLLLALNGYVFSGPGGKGTP